MTHKRLVRVSGIPVGRHDDDLVMDKLLIHFLRRKNGGNGEVDVRYPIMERGVAMLTFDLVEVADRVLTRRHQLEVEGRTYPLEVSRPQQQGMEFSMPIVTSLDLNYFDDIPEVRRILRKHNLNVYREGSLNLSIEGDFLDLRRCRDELKTMNNPPFLGQDHTGHLTSRHPREYRPDDYGVSREEAHMRNSNTKQSSGGGLPNAAYKASDRNPSPSRARRTSESLPTENNGYGSAGDKSKPPYIKPLLTHNKRTASSSVVSGQRKVNDASSDDSTSTPKHRKSKMAANLHFPPAPPEKIPADEDRRPGANSPLTSNGRPSHSSGLASHSVYTSTQFGESRPPKNADSTSSQSKPKGTITGKLISNPKHPNSSIKESSSVNPGQPKNVSASHSNSSQSQPKRTINDEVISNPKNPNSTTRDTSSFIPGQPKNVSESDSSSSQSHPKGTINDEFISNPKHHNSTIRDGSGFNPGQPKNASESDSSSSQSQPKRTINDEFISNPKHHNSTTRDTSSFVPGQPKNVSASHSSSSQSQPKRTINDEFISNPKHHNSGGDNPNFNSVKPKNTSSARKPEDSSTSSAHPSPPMAAGWSPSGPPTVHPAIRSKNYSDQSPLFTEFYVDPAAHTYISVFMKDEIDKVLGRSKVEMKTENAEGFNRVVLTAQSPDLSQLFYKAAHEISDLFMKCQSSLRVQSIDLSDISTEGTRKLQTHLFHRGIWSSPDKRRLQVIGPSNVIFDFMEKWTSARGDLQTLIHLSQGRSSPGPPRPPAVGMDNVNPSSAQHHDVTRETRTLNRRGEGSGARGGREPPSNRPRR